MKERERARAVGGRGRERDWLLYICQLFAVWWNWPWKCLFSSPPRCIFSSFQPHRGLLIQLCSPSCKLPWNPSFYLHHLAEAKNTLPKNPLPDKKYHPIATVHIHLAYNCLSGLGPLKLEIYSCFPYALLEKVYHQYETLIPPKPWINRLINFNTLCFMLFIQNVLHCTWGGTIQFNFLVSPTLQFWDLWGRYQVHLDKAS